MAHSDTLVEPILNITEVYQGRDVVILDQHYKETSRGAVNI